MTSSKSARLARRDARRARSREPRTEPIPALRTTGYDATTITFAGASDIGLPDADLAAAQAPPRPAYDATVPVSCLIGNTLALDPHWGPKFAILPCGHCGAGFGGARPADLLHLWNPLMTVKARAWEAGWRLDVDQTLTCPDCQQDKTWLARQGQVAMRQPHGIPDYQDCRWHDGGERGVPCTCPASHCDRHDMLPVPGVPLHEYRCTCPGAVLATDVMLASEDYLGSGRGRHRTVTR